MYGIYEGGKVIAKFAAPMSVRSNRPAFASDTLSLRRFVSQRTAQRWEISTAVVPMSSDAQDFFVNMVTNGHGSPVLVRVPQNYGVIKARDVPVALPAATGSANASSVTLSSHSGFMPKGTFLKFQNHNKLYITTADRSNNGSVGIFPELRVAVGNTPVYCGDNVDVNFKYDLDTILGMSYTDGILMDMGTVKLVEAV
jgi:hypothetical protein